MESPTHVIRGIEEYAISRAAYGHLAIHIAERHVVCAIKDTDRDEIIWFGEYIIPPNNSVVTGIRQLLLSEKVFDAIYRKCTLSTHHSEFVIVPKGFFDPEKKSGMITEKSGSEIYHQAVGFTDAVVLFQMEKDLERAISERFPTLALVSLAAILAQYGAMHHDTGDHIYMILGESRMILSAFSSGKFLLCNYFDVRRADDVLYHIANTAIQLNLDLEHTVLHPGGKIQLLHGLDEMLKTYSSVIMPINPDMRFYTNSRPADIENFSAALFHFVCA